MDELGLSESALSKAMGEIISQPAIHKIVTGKTRKTKYIVELARALKMDPVELETGHIIDYAVGSGGAIARVEVKNTANVNESSQRYGSNVAALSEGIEPGTVQIRSVPVLSSKEVLQGKPDNNNKGRAYAPAQQVSSAAFAYSVSEIPNPNDRFGIDTAMLVIVDPDADWMNGKLMLIKDNNDNLIIRRYEIIGNKRYLAPHNERYDPIELNDDFTIIGRIVGRYASE